MSRVVQTESLEKKPDNSSISAESEEKKKKKLLRKVTVKIGLKQKDNGEGIIVETLLDSEATELVMGLEFARENNFKKKKLDRLIYVRNVNGIFNHEWPIEHTVEVELFYREHNKKIKIDMIREQKWSVILKIL